MNMGYLSTAALAVPGLSAAEWEVEELIARATDARPRRKRLHHTHLRRFYDEWTKGRGLHARTARWRGLSRQVPRLSPTDILAVVRRFLFWHLMSQEIVRGWIHVNRRVRLAPANDVAANPC
jgi:hypothetical protein